MGRACSRYGREEECRTGFRWENQKVRDHWDDLDVDWRNGSWINRMGWIGLDLSSSG
jgi:hypothetical protein